MVYETVPRLVRRLNYFAVAAGVLPLAVGLSGVAGWVFSIPFFNTWGAAPVTMKVNSACCFALGGTSLLLLRKPNHSSFAWLKKSIARTAATLVSLVGLLSLLENLFGWDFGMDQWLAKDASVTLTSLRAGLMSPITAGVFVLLGLALLTIDWRTRRERWPAQYLSLTAGAGATFGILGFAFDPHIYVSHLSLALPSAVTLTVFSLGLVCSRTEYGLGALLCSQSLGGSLARRLLPAAFVPVIVGWIRWQISAVEWFSAWSIVVVSSLITMVLLGGLIAWAAVVVDRSDAERKHNEEARERLAAIVDSSDDAIVSKTLEGTITAWNSGAEKLFGYSAEEAVGQPIRMLLPAERAHEESDILARVRRGESIDHFETVRVRRDGRRIDVSATISPIRNGSGAIVGASKIARDITERKRTEAALAEQAEELSLQAQELMRSQQALQTQTALLQSVLDSMAEGLVAADAQGRFVIWNPAAEKIVGLGPAKLSTQAWSEHYGLFLPDTITPFPPEQNPLARAIGGEVSNAELFVRNPALSQGVWVEANAHPLRDANGALCGGVVAFRDITQKRMAEQEIRQLNSELEQRVIQRTAQLEEANKELEAFTYSVSHDLRAPLRHMAGFSGILLEEYGASLDPQARKYLQRIQDATVRMGLLVDELLNLARVGRKSLDLQVTGLNPIVDEVVTMLAPDAEGRQVKWKIAKLPFVECDPTLIKQVFQNLLSNALKYSRPRPEAVIEVGRTEANGETALFVRDNGVGFSMKYADKLFGVFQRLHRAEDFEGTGVGLATVQRIIKKHHGRIWADAELDRGATFFFTLGNAAQGEPEMASAMARGQA